MCVLKLEKQKNNVQSYSIQTRKCQILPFLWYIHNGLIWIILFWDHPQRRESHTWVLWIIIIFVNWWELLVYDRCWIFQLFTLNTVCLLLKHHTIKKCPFLIWYVWPLLVDMKTDISLLRHIAMILRKLKIDTVRRIIVSPLWIDDNLLTLKKT